MAVPEPTTVVGVQDLFARYAHRIDRRDFAAFGDLFTEDARFALADNWAEGRGAIRDFMADYHQWVWFVDDDNPLHPELLMWLLNRDVDIIQPLVVNRKPPYVSHCHRFNDDHTSLDIVPWDEIPGEGLFECDGVGAGGMLIQRRVLDAMDDPWFRTGEQNIEHIQEDTSFCIRAKQLGFHVFTDLDHSIGHCHTHTVYPTHEGGRWRIQHVIGAGYVFMSEPDHPVSALTS
jgi:hypothetical protein